MENAKTCYALLVVVIASVSWAPRAGVLATCCDDQEIKAVQGTAHDQSYIVYTDTTKKPDRFSLHKHWYAAMINEASGSELSDAMTSSLLLHTYDTVAHGFATKLTTTAAAAMESIDGCLGIVADSINTLDTTRSPDFLGLNPSNGVWPDSHFGMDIIIGVLDTGIWPESKSFSDQGLKPVDPPKWKGTCEVTTDFNASNCNNKLIGARYFFKGFEAMSGAPIDETVNYKSPRDANGHGSHTASIAAGSEVAGANLFGFAKGTARGVATKARLAIYKVCWLKRHPKSDLKLGQNCTASGILAGMDAAVKDGVDLISMSLSKRSASRYCDDPLAIGQLRATLAGVFVSSTAGNNGPDNYPVSNTAPWIITVGAGSIDREFPTSVVLGNGTTYTGSSLCNASVEQLPLVYEKALSINSTANICLDPGTVGGKVVAYPSVIGDMAPLITTEINTRTPLLKGDFPQLPLVYGKSASSSNGTAKYCSNGTLDPNMVRGKIVLCDRGGGQRANIGLIVQKAGGAGMILANGRKNGKELKTDCHFLPATNIDYRDGAAIKAYIKETENPTAAIINNGETVVGKARAPVVAAFSSRGPNRVVPEILKPDLIAPGVNILAAWSGERGPTGLIPDERRVYYNIQSGTSMACPHVTGIAALLRAVHPEWTPAAIKSALMTTSGLLDNKNGSIEAFPYLGLANAFALGAGHVNPNAAVDPGLVYDLGIDDYIRFFCSLNYTEKEIEILTNKKVSCPTNATLHPGDLNYPSFSVVFKPENLVFATKRTVTNVGNDCFEYEVAVRSPTNVNITVHPTSLSFKTQNETASFTVTFEDKLSPDFKHEEFGQICWECQKNGKKWIVRSPVAISWVEAN